MDKSNFPIVYYRLPNEQEICVLQSEHDGMEIDSLKNVPEKPGFILVPFSSNGSVKSYFIQAERFVTMSLEDVYGNALVDDSTWNVKTQSASNTFSKTKEEYCKNVSDAVTAIHSDEFQKVVLSRVKSLVGVAPGNPLMIFWQLCTKYPAAFVSLVYIPGDVLWITATPELLASSEHNNISTVSLAGTKPVDSYEEWSDKEKMEQQMVTDYINEILKRYCENINVSSPQEVIAGNVKHLKTSFSATLNSGFWNFVSALHPTPAVCGIPLDKAKHFIEKTEGYDRKYYTGFLGPCNLGGNTNLFVNLRCAEIFENGVNLYIGGGITKDSVPEKEWEETELKSKTLLFAFEESRHEKK